VFKKVLVPLDGSRLAESVLPAALFFAETFHAEIVLFHVIEASPPQAVHGERHLLAADEAHSYLGHVVQRLARPDLALDSDVHSAKEVDVARSIIEHTRELGADLVILCAHGSGGWRNVVVGSIAQQVIQHGTTPVFLVRPGLPSAQGSYKCRRILLPLDGSAGHEPALPVAVEVARTCGAALHVLTVVPTASTLSPQGAATGMLLPSTMAAVLDLAQRDAIAYLQRITAALVAEDVKVSAEVMRGDPTSSILDETIHFQADMVIVATHGRTTLDSFWSGGVTPRILSQSKAPVLLVRGAGEEAPR
jgi:nucleotide-binding universal stress UspA family protein